MPPKTSIPRRRIAIDCDDVIVPTASLIIENYNKTYGTSLTLDNYYSYDLKIWGVSDDAIAIKRIDNYLMTAEYQGAKPFREAIDTIHALSKYYDLHMVTGRADFLAESTLAMLARYFPDIFKSTQFTNFFGKQPRTKAAVCQELDADLPIDDHLHHAEGVAKCGI